MNTEKQDEVEREREEIKERAKKPYSTPQLTRFGRVEEFTGTIIIYDA